MLLLRRIFFGFSFFLISVASVYSVFVFCPDIGAFAATSEASQVVSTSSTETVSKPEQTNEQERVSSAVAETSSETSVQTDSQSQAKGKIITKSVALSSGNLKYNNVSINNNTGLSIDLKTELLKAPSLKISDISDPQVLIVHTHTTECYMNEKRDYYTEQDASRSTDDTKNLVAVGQILKSGLEAQGIGVIHATEKHDYPEYTGSYDRAAVTIKKYLQKYPTIKVVIDLHRDAMMDSSGNKTALTSIIKGKEAAQVMIVSGCENGGVTGFPNWKENFRLAIRLQQTMEEKYPSLARPILFTSRKYNQHITNGSLLIECGTDANTLEQAKYSAVLIADSLATTLKALK